jgi:hypothetical protein
MKKVSVFLGALIFCVANIYGQTANDIVCVFTKKENGKVFTKNEDGSRFVNFVITGIKSDEQAAVLRENVKKNSFIIDFTISQERNSNERNAYASIIKGTKMDIMWNLLLNNGIDYIKLDDKVSQVSLIKLSAEKKHEKMMNKKTP